MKENAGVKIGMIKVRLFRPWSIELLLRALPKTVKAIAVLEKTKECGASDPMYLDVLSAFENTPGAPFVVGGRYGLGGKEFTPACVRAVYDNLSALPKPKNHFTVGINDDITHLSLAIGPEPVGVIPPSTVQCVFFGLGADGTVGANHDAIRIIGDNTDLNVQGYFFYDARMYQSLSVSLFLSVFVSLWHTPLTPLTHSCAHQKTSLEDSR